MSEGAIRGLVFVLSGPSGVGKDTVLQELAHRRFGLGRVVTAVTRAPRPGERHGVDYHFMDRERFRELVDAGEFVEWADYVASPRGTPLFSLRQTLAAGRDALLKIDVEGFREVRQRFPNVISIFLGPPTFEVLERRIRGRDDNTPESEIIARLEQARRELGAMAEYEYAIVNEDGRPADAADRLAAIVIAERLRVRPRLTELGA